MLGELSFEVLNLIVKLGNRLFIQNDVGAFLRHQQFQVFVHLFLDVAGATRVLKGVDRFLEGLGGGANAGNHDCLGVAAEGVF